MRNLLHELTAAAIFITPLTFSATALLETPLCALEYSTFLKGPQSLAKIRIQLGDLCAL
jgi:hypothetical protein